MQHYFIPTIRAAIKLRQHDPAAAIELLRGTAKYDLAFTGSVVFVPRLHPRTSVSGARRWPIGRGSVPKDDRQSRF